MNSALHLVVLSAAEQGLTSSFWPPLLNLTTSQSVARTLAARGTVVDFSFRWVFRSVEVERPDALLPERANLLRATHVSHLTHWHLRGFPL